MGRTTNSLTAVVSPESSLESATGLIPLQNSEAHGRKTSSRAEKQWPGARVLLIQTDPLMCLGIESFLNQEAGFSVGKTAFTPTDALESLEQTEPDIVICELSITGAFNFAFLKEFRAKHPELPLLAVSAHEEVILARRALEAGANGYLMKDAPPGKLTEALNTILDGHKYLSDRVRTRILREKYAEHQRLTGFLNGSRISSFDLQELEVFHFLGENLTVEEVQEATRLSSEELASVVQRLLKKLELETFDQLIQFAFHWVYYEGDFA